MDIEKQMAVPGFWDNSPKAQKCAQQLSRLKTEISSCEKIDKEVDDVSVLVELAEEAQDTKMQDEIMQAISEIEGTLADLEFRTLMDGEFDRHNAILSIHAGAGGTESCDWAQMLLRMYEHWVQKRGYQSRVLDLLHGDEAGVKNVTVLVSGEHAYGYLKAETGVHRLVRISPFDSQSRRHTSFSSVNVIPEIEEEVEVELNQADLRIETFRASGHGGQHVNVTDSAVRITHLPTRITSQCQDERSQHRNKDMALKILRSRLFEHYRRLREEKVAKEWKEKGEIAWGNQIRSYTFHPFSLVKDHRTGVEIGNVQAVMDGGIDRFIKAYLQWVAESNSS